VGSLQAQEFASLTAAGDVSLEQSLAWHLRANHYPPVPLSMIQACVQAIEIGQRYQWGDADLNDRVDLPDGVLWREQGSAPAWAIIEAHHLDAFIQSEEEE
jgi:hypothetical protein